MNACSSALLPSLAVGATSPRRHHLSRKTIEEHLDTSGFAAEEVYVEHKDQSCFRNALEILEDFWGRDVASENGSPRQTYLETALPGGASSPRTARTYRRNWKNEIFGKDWVFDVFVAFGHVNKEMVAATVLASSRARRARRKALLSQHRRGRRPSEADGTGEADGCQDSACPRTGAQTDIGIRISVQCAASPRALLPFIEQTSVRLRTRSSGPQRKGSCRRHRQCSYVPTLPQ